MSLRRCKIEHYLDDVHRVNSEARFLTVRPFTSFVWHQRDTVMVVNQRPRRVLMSVPIFLRDTCGVHTQHNPQHNDKQLLNQRSDTVMPKLSTAEIGHATYRHCSTSSDPGKCYCEPSTWIGL